MTSDKYVAGQAQFEVPSFTSLGGTTSTTRVWEKDLIHAVWRDRPTDAEGETTSECGVAVFRSPNPTEWPPASGTLAEACQDCLAKTITLSR